MIKLVLFLSVTFSFSTAKIFLIKARQGSFDSANQFGADYENIGEQINQTGSVVGKGLGRESLKEINRQKHFRCGSAF